MEIFGASEHMVKMSRKLKKENGILPEVPLLSKGRKISEEEQSSVKRFYKSDEISRQLPGMKDSLSIKDSDGKRQQIQKKLVLGNLKEIFEKFKEEERNPKISFSTFALLRPRECVLAGSGGTHTVCVCTHHQNPKLQLDAIGEKNVSLEDVMAQAVCDLNREDCMMRNCHDCPGKDGVFAFAQGLPAMEGREQVRSKMWVSVDRCDLIDVVEDTDDFLKKLSSAIEKLTRHHFVAKKIYSYF